MLRNLLYTIIIIGFGILTGCNSSATRKLLTVDFQQGQTLRYKFLTSRDISIDWDASKNKGAGQKKLDKSSESVEMVVSYTPVDVDPYGLTTIRAVCESVKAKRKQEKGSGSRAKDAVESVSGRSFTFTIGPTGKVEDYSELNKLIKRAGEKAFRTGSTRGRIKEPDLIDDFIATQWFLWDSVSSLKNVTKGARIGQTWTSQLSVPTSMVFREARNVTYRLEEVRETERGQVAVIRSSYSLAKSVPRSWPVPYSGRFRMAGTFGFFRSMLRGLKVVDLQGQGEELFNIDAGRTKGYSQQYEMHLQTSGTGPLGLNPLITIKQTLTMQLLEN